MAPSPGGAGCLDRCHGARCARAAASGSSADSKVPPDGCRAIGSNTSTSPTPSTSSQSTSTEVRAADLAVVPDDRAAAPVPRLRGAVLSPADGVVVDLHDGEVDHEGRRSQPALLGRTLTQASRVRRKSLRSQVTTRSSRCRRRARTSAWCTWARLVVRGPRGAGRAGDAIGVCGNPGNSTEPHVHAGDRRGGPGGRARPAVGNPRAARPGEQPRPGPRRGRGVDGG